MGTSAGVAPLRSYAERRQGGFASARSEPERLNLSAFQGLVLHVRGGGKRYQSSRAQDAVTALLTWYVNCGPLPDAAPGDRPRGNKKANWVSFADPVGL